jgi:hypothetical protein
MKIKPIKYLKSLNWTKDDAKKFIFCVLVILTFCLCFKKICLKRVVVVGDVEVHTGQYGSLEVSGDIYQSPIPSPVR